ncbi:MAG: hypothetical protein GY874_02805 [Desulfobacteraceae bacterium]|nr:hypothetical protein [Desulfobacteraceae bacterium]
MKKSIIILMTLIMAIATQSFAQHNEDNLANDNQSFQEKNKHPVATQALTDNQKAQVKAVLSKYDASTLTADDAKAIHEAFRKAGLRAGPAMESTIREAGFDPHKLRDLAPPATNRGKNTGRYKNHRSPQMQTNSSTDRPMQISKPVRSGGPGHQRYSIEQAISDRAQLHTIAFNGLAFITGSFGEYTFIPPGKVCDFFGFQYMRDIDVAGKGHNPMFLNRVVGNVMRVLSNEQRKLFFDLAEIQAKELESLALKRLPLIKSFDRELNGQRPGGTSKLNRNAVAQYVGELFAHDAKLSYARAEIFGKVASSLTAKQKAYLGKMQFGDFNTWPDLDEQKSIIKGKSHLFNVAYMTFASEFFSWYAGSTTADTYFCPERHGTYFGGFYMKDMPAMGKRDFDISTAVTGNSGENFLNILNEEQRRHISIIIDQQRKPLQEIIDVRRAMSVELRKFLTSNQADKGKVLALGKRYGELDGELSWLYATAFAKVNRTLTTVQRTKLEKLRNIGNYVPAPAYLYSSPMKKLPKLPNTNHFFFEPKR